MYLPQSFNAAMQPMSPQGFAPCESGRKCGSSVRGREEKGNAVYDSIACDSTSNPEHAVTLEGSDSVTVGSTTAIDGRIALFAIPVFALASSKSNTQIAVTSDPVPAVVGHAM